MSRELADRLRIVLLAGEGWLNVEIAAQLAVSVATVAKWRDRFALAGISGLADRPRSGRPRQVDRAAIVAATLCPPTATGVTRWSSRELANQLGIGEATVARAWREYGLTPRLGGAFTFAVQPELTAGAVELVGVCLTRRARAVALTLDAVDDRSSQRSPAGHATASGTEAGEFVSRLAHSHPGRLVHVVVDSADTRSTLVATHAPDADSGIRVHFTLSTVMWLNLLDVWSWMIIRDADVDGTHAAAQIRAVIDAGQPASWLKSAMPSTAVDSGVR